MRRRRKTASSLPAAPARPAMLPPAPDAAAGPAARTVAFTKVRSTRPVAVCAVHASYDEARGSGETDRGEEGSGKPVAACEDAAEVFEAAEGILDAMPLLAGSLVEAERLETIGAVGYDGLGAALVEPLPQCGAVIGGIAEQLGGRFGRASATDIASALAGELAAQYLMIAASAITIPRGSPSRRLPAMHVTVRNPTM